jgi:hypothetical protein
MNRPDRGDEEDELVVQVRELAECVLIIGDKTEESLATLERTLRAINSSLQDIATAIKQHP